MTTGHGASEGTTGEAAGEAVITYHAAGGVVMRDGQGDGPEILLLERPSRNEVRLPKGHIDPGETPRQTALRETAEETGFSDLEIIADLGEQMVGFHFQGQRVLRHERYYLMRLRSPQTIPRPAGDEAQFQPRWVPLDQAASLLTFEAERQRIHQSIRYLTAA